jgi:DNA polymerase-1
MIFLDFETEGIQARPNYPPKPVGLAVLKNNHKKYWAWGHPTDNNCTLAQATRELADCWNSGDELGFHNAKFDVDVAVTHMGMKPLSWSRIHDTLYGLFLHDPHSKSLSLKPASEQWLGMAPEERNAVNEWLHANGVIKRVDQKDAGAYICMAPGSLVGAYAIGDVVRTKALHKFLMPKIKAAGMLEAYDRERRLMPILLANEQSGMRVDDKRLANDIVEYELDLKKTDDWLRKKLQCENIDSDVDVAGALKRLDLITEWHKTPTGRDSVSKKYLTPAQFKDKKICSALGYRNRLSTVLSMSMRPWLEQAQRCGGYITTEWNQVRQAHGADGAAGTRTGRLSCSRFMNITKDFTDKDDGYVHPNFLGVRVLPLVRKYILPQEGGVFCHRDYNQQELRILAHFEDGALCGAYNANPRLDIHEHVRQLIKEILGLDLNRRTVKPLNFGKVYGMGVTGLMQKLGCTREEAEQLIRAHKAALPGVAALDADIKHRARQGGFIRTWGGRVYYCESPKLINGVMRTFEYKLLNYLIQGSAADCTKEALIRYDEAKQYGRLMVTVHDEINISVPKSKIKSEMKILKDVMNSVEFDVPMISDGKIGPNWGDLKKYEDPNE